MNINEILSFILQLSNEKINSKFFQKNTALEMLLHGRESSHSQNLFIIYSTLPINPYLLIIHSFCIVFHLKSRLLYPNRRYQRQNKEFHMKLFLNCSVFQLNSFTLWNLIYIHGMVFTFMLLTAIPYRFRNQKKTIRYLGTIPIKQRKYLCIILNYIS